MKLLSVCTAALLASQALGAAIGHKLNGFSIIEHPDPTKRELLQKRVRDNSLMGRGGCIDCNR